MPLYLMKQVSSGDLDLSMEVTLAVQFSELFINSQPNFSSFANY